MGTTITGGDGLVPTITSGISLAAADSPLLITAGALGARGTIYGDTYGIYGDTSQAWSITNQDGLVRGTDSGIVLASDGGTIVNHGTVYGPTGIAMAGGTVTNSGLLYGFRPLVASGSASISNTGEISTVIMQGYDAAIRLAAGGRVTNAGSIAGDTGIAIEGAAGSVDNTGDIRGGRLQASVAVGIRMAQGGSVTNGSEADPRATITGYHAGISILGTGTVVNNATVKGIPGVYGTAASGIVLESGTVTNGTGHNSIALIQSYQADAVTFLDGAGTLVNLGSIAALGTATYAVMGAGSIVNAGNIRAGRGIRMPDGMDATLANYARIEATDTAFGTAVRFGTGDDRLVLGGLG